MTFAAICGVAGFVEGVKAVDLLVPGVKDGCIKVMRNGQLDFASITIALLGLTGAIAGCYIGTMCGNALDQVRG